MNRLADGVLCGCARQLLSGPPTRHRRINSPATSVSRLAVREPLCHLAGVSDIAGNLQRVRARMSAAAQRCGRDAAAVRLIGISKTQPAAVVQRAIDAGLADVGENYVQEMIAKRPGVHGAVTWHLVGHLQRNKAGRAVELFDVIHSVDSRALGQALARQGERRQQAVQILVEVNVGDERSKSGIAIDAAEPLIAALGDLRWLRIEGLMTIPPPGSKPDDSRPYFQTLRRLRDRLRATAPANAPLRELSMGMTDDFEVAIEEGATMVRVGRAIFGERTG
ncbi:MAG: YggS family pyridoxal phosphate-dependent enzyme [Deltaproteobacteria bacterium]|nr:YggS family pyridoxal phosphate-dependent enzyme [Deltaproteobacteria bacterium]